MAKFEVGDEVLLNGTLQVTLLSWPATDAGPFNYEFSLAEGTTVRGLDYAEIANVTPLAPLAAPPAEDD